MTCIDKCTEKTSEQTDIVTRTGANSQCVNIEYIALLLKKDR